MVVLIRSTLYNNPIGSCWLENIYRAAVTRRLVYYTFDLSEKDSENYVLSFSLFVQIIYLSL